jgi:hypothetical protein
MEATEDRRALAISASLAALAALVPFWFYNIAVKYPLPQKVVYAFDGLAWDPLVLNILLGIPFVVFASQTLRRAGSHRKSIRALIVVLGFVCFIYILQTILVLTTWSINGFAP